MDKKVLAGRMRLVLLAGSARAWSPASIRPRRSQATLLRALRGAGMTTANALAGSDDDTVLAPYAQRAAAVARPARRGAAAAPSHRVPARPRPHRALHGVPPPGLQDPGVRQPRGRPLPHAPDALDRGGADRPQRGARAGPERGAGRGDLPRARPRSYAVRPCRRGCAERLHARLRRLRAQPAVAAGRRRAGGALRRFPRPQPHLRGARRHPQALLGRQRRRLGELGERFLRAAAAVARGAAGQPGRRDRLQQPRRRRRPARRPDHRRGAARGLRMFGRQYETVQRALSRSLPGGGWCTRSCGA